MLVLNLADAQALLGDTAASQALYASLVERFEAGDLQVIPEVAAQAYAQAGDFESALGVVRNQQQEWTDRAMGAFAAALVYTLSGQNIAALVEVNEALQGGLNPMSFNLEWFSALCAEPRFTELMSAAGNPGRCSGGEPAP